MAVLLTKVVVSVCLLVKFVERLSTVTPMPVLVAFVEGQGQSKTKQIFVSVVILLLWHYLESMLPFYMLQVCSVKLKSK